LSGLCVDVEGVHHPHRSSAGGGVDPALPRGRILG
jgi:hypothetical protein